MFAISACASGGIEITSTPDNAEIFTLQGESVGKTPLTLSKEQQAKLVENDFVNFKIAARGHVPRIVTLDADTLRKFNVVLPKADAQGFKSEVLREFSQDVNALTRRSFMIQKLLQDKRLPEAETEIEKFKKDYVSSAFGFVMSAHLSVLQGKRDQARSDLLRAQALDPDDPSIVQSIKVLFPDAGRVPTSPAANGEGAPR